MCILYDFASTVLTAWIGTLTVELFMIDLIYILASILFFSLMILYVVGCERLGRTAEVERAAEQDQ